MKILFTTLFFLLIGYNSISQQLTYEPSTFEYSLAFNPAMTGADHRMSFGAIYRKQWVGFQGSPQHIGVFAQYPLADYKIAGGVYMIHDKEGPIRSTTFGFNSSYQLPGIIQSEDELSLGLGLKLNFTQISYEELIATDQQSFEQNFRSESINTPEVDFGLYYVSDASSNYGSRYFGGIAINNLKSMFINDKNTNSVFDPATHYNLILGYDFRQFVFGYKTQGYNFYLKPTLWLDYAAYSPMRVLIGVDVGIWDFLYTGLYFSNESSIHFKVGLNLRNKMMKDGSLKIQLFPSFNYGQLKETKGLNFDIGITYGLEVN